MNGLTLTALLTSHKAGLGASAKKFAAADDADLKRHFDKALPGFSKIRRRTLVAHLSLQAGVANYPAPNDMLAPTISRWGVQKLQPWQPGYGPLPKIGQFELDGQQMINLHPAPTIEQISCFGTEYPLFYLALHRLSDEEAESTIRPADQDLFLLLALIEAMTELVASGVTEPVSLQRSMGAVNSNMTPSAALTALNSQLERMR